MSRRLHNRLIHVTLAVVGALAVVLAVVEFGSAGPAIRRPLPKPDAQPAAKLPPAVDYRVQGELGPPVNRDFKSRIESLIERHPEAATGREALLAALRERADWRAFAGAPPVVPHPVTQRSTASCLACHEQGLAVDGRLAPKISHPPYASCTQCHVESHNRAFPTPETSTAFVGAVEQQGRRAWFEAPPEIPHDLHMRNDCRSCHGPRGEPALRTSHPERANCLQCHALSSPAMPRPQPVGQR